MADHTHDLGPLQWPFQDAEHTACFSCRHVLDEGDPILCVAHDADDGAWQFLCGQPHELDDARLVCLGCMVVKDQRLVGLADLPIGWCADREDSEAPWVREVNDAPEDEEGG